MTSYAEAEAAMERDLAAAGRGRKSGHEAQKSAPWPDPIDDAAYYGVLGDITQTIAPHTEADPVAILTQLLVAAGNVIGRGPHLLLDGAEHHLVLYAAIVGATSKARKGTSWAHVRRVMRGVDEEWAAHRIVGGASSGEGLIYAVRDPIDGQTKKGEVEVVDEGVTDKRLLDVESEMSSVLRRCGRDGNTLSEQIRQAWETGTLQTLTRGRQGAMPMRATDAHISMIGHITERELEIRLAETDAWNGLANRYTWICARRARTLPFGGGEPDMRMLGRRLANAVAGAQHIGRIKIDDDAKELWATVYPAYPDDPGLLGAVTARGEPITLRIAAIYAVLDGRREIGRAHLEAALAVWDYAYASARYLFGGRTGDRVADRILEALARAGERGMTRTEVRDLLGGSATAARLDAALASLVAAGRVTESREETRGRPRIRYRVATGGQ